MNMGRRLASEICHLGLCHVGLSTQSWRRRVSLLSKAAKILSMDGPCFQFPFFSGLKRGPFYFSTYSIIEEASSNKGVGKH